MNRYKKVKILHNLMRDLIDENTEFADKWEDFWRLSQRVVIVVDIDWYDPDTSYEEDIMSRFNAIGSWLDKRS